MDNSTQELVNETLRKMGRNLHNYQIVERIWKEQYKTTQVKFTAENQEKMLANSREIPNKITMGPLSEIHMEAMFHPKNETELEEVPEKTLFTGKISFHISECEGQSVNRKNIVDRLVNERNALAHSSSEQFDHITGFDCIEFCALLDEQNSRIIEEINYLNSISTSYKESMAALIGQLKQMTQSDIYIYSVNGYYQKCTGEEGEAPFSFTIQSSRTFQVYDFNLLLIDLSSKLVDERGLMPNPNKIVVTRLELLGSQTEIETAIKG